jgi:hypothetical protein
MPISRRTALVIAALSIIGGAVIGGWALPIGIALAFWCLFETRRRVRDQLINDADQ